MIDLLCIDVDGTLVGASGQVRPAVWAATERARAQGLHLSLCSGRPAFGVARAYAERLDPEGWHVFQNGASVLHLPTGRSLSAKLPEDLVSELVGRARSLGRLLELYSDDEYAVEQDSERARRHAELLGVPFAVRPFESLRGPVVRAQWLVPEAEGEALLGEPAPGLERTSSTSPIMPGTLFVNLTRAGIDKGSAVRAIAEALGIPLSRVMAVGDGGNDLGMLRAVGHPVAMGNAEPALLAAARLVVRSVEEDGLLEAIDLALA